MSNRVLINIVLIFLTFPFYSCVAKKGVKKLENQVKSILDSKNETASDLDGDLIDNDKEIELGLNPNYPNVPRLSISNVHKTIFKLKLKKNNEIKNVEITSAIKHNDDLRDLMSKMSNEWLQSTLNKIHYEQLATNNSTISLDNILRMDKLAIIPLQKKAFFEYSDLLDDGWKVIDGSIKAELQLLGTGVSQVKTIDKISVSLGTTVKYNDHQELSLFKTLYSSSGTPLVLTVKNNEDEAVFDSLVEVHTNTLDADLLDKILRSQRYVSINVGDFRFNRLDKSNTLSGLLNSVNTKNTKIVIKEGDQIESFYSLKNKTLKDFFKTVSKTVSHDDVFNLIGINGKDSTLKLPLSSNDIENQNTDNGNWKILNGDFTLNTNLSDLNMAVFSYIDVTSIKRVNAASTPNKSESFLLKDSIKLKTDTNNLYLVTLNLSKNEDFIEKGSNSISKNEEVCTRGRGGSGGRRREGGGESDTELCEVKNYQCHVEWNILKTRSLKNLPLDIQQLEIQSNGTSFLNLNGEDFFQGNNGRIKILFNSDNALTEDLLSISIKNSLFRFPVMIGNRFIQKSEKLGNCGSPLNYIERQHEGIISHSLNGEILTINKNTHFDLVD